MVKNLDLDLSTSITLDSTTSDLTAGRTWTPQNSTQTTTGTIWNANNTAQSYSTGNLYYANGSSVGSGTQDNHENYAGQSSGEPWYRVGTYYNWYAATAGTGTAAMTSGNATDSICPKGWKLPAGDDSIGSFYYLIHTTYGIALGATSFDVVKMTFASPLTFVHGGMYSPTGGYTYRQGDIGNYHTSTATSETLYRYLNIGRGGVSISDANKLNGWTIRCLAR